MIIVSRPEIQKDKVQRPVFEYENFPIIRPYWLHTLCILITYSAYYVPLLIIHRTLGLLDKELDNTVSQLQKAF